MRDEEKTIVFTCDRCGVSQKASFPSELKTWTELMSDKVYLFGDTLTTRKDICPKCTEEFRVWWYNESEGTETGVHEESESS